MKQEAFERSRELRWRDFDAALFRLDSGRAAPEFPRAFRLLCQDLVLARDRRFSAGLVDRLNALALRGHQHLYGTRAGRLDWIGMLLRRFPRAVRREWRLLVAVSLLFYGTALAVFALDLRNPELVYSVMSPQQVASFEQMYDPAAPHYGAPRVAIDGVTAFLFYVGNNVGVAFRTFASGILGGVGSLVFLLVNAVLFGAVAAHVTQLGYAHTFFPFVVGHGAFELTAILLAGVSGLRIGLALVVPGRASRGRALREAALACVPILYGMTCMLVIAAVLEGLWSGSPAIPERTKLIVGAGLWTLVCAWLSLGGRGSEPA